MDPEAVDAVFTATDRAAGVRTAATGIGEAVRLTPWEGQAHDPAQQATGRIQTDLLDHAAESDAVAKAANLAGTEFRDVRRTGRVQQKASGWGITINAATGSCPTLPQSESRTGFVMEQRVDEIEADIQNLLSRANNADEALAGAIRVTSGLESAEDLEASLAAPPSSISAR